MDTTIAATKRTADLGKGAARKSRKAGQIPGVVYGKDAVSTPILIDPARLDTIFRTTKNRNTVVRLEVDGKTVPCLVRDLQRHPLTRKMLHVDLYALEPGQQVNVMVPVTTSGKAAGAALGGRIAIVRRDLQVACAWESIPEVIDIDVSPLDIGDFVRVASLTPPSGCQFVYDMDFNVVSCLGKKSGGPGPAEA